jgi:hypothetical protein
MIEKDNLRESTHHGELVYDAHFCQFLDDFLRVFDIDLDKQDSQEIGFLHLLYSSMHIFRM